MVVLPELISPGDISVDVGANRGIYAFAMARIAAVVHCFEPLKECCDYIEAYGSPRITVRNTALSETDGDFELFVPIENGRRLMTRASLDPIDGPHEKRIIPVARLDNFQLGPVAFIKVDVEGLEFSVLRGATETIRATRPKLLIEIDRTRHTADSFQALLQWLDGMGYDPYTANDGTLNRCLDPWSAKASIYNFVFLPKPTLPAVARQQS